MRQVFKLELAEARTMVVAAIAKAAAIQVPETVCVCDEGGYPLSLERMDGAVMGGIGLSGGMAGRTSPVAWPGWKRCAAV